MSHSLIFRFIFCGLCLLTSRAYAGPDSLWLALRQAQQPDDQATAAFALAAYHQMRSSDSVYHYADVLEGIGRQHQLPLARVQAENIRGRTHHNAGDITAAIRYYNAAITLAQQYKVVNELGGLHLNKGLSQVRGFALDSAYASLTQAEKYYRSTQQHDQLWRCYNAFATLETGREDYPAADQYYSRALADAPRIAQRAERAYVIYQAFAYGFKHRRFDVMAAARQQWDAYKSEQPLTAATLERPEHIGLYEMSSDDPAAIETVMLAAIAHYQAAGNTLRQAWSYEDLGELYLSQSRTADAIAAFEQAEARMRVSESASQLAAMRKRLAQLHKDAGQWRQALHYTEAANAIIDSLRNAAAERNLQEFRVQYATEQKEQALRISRLEVGRTTQQRNAWIGAAVLLAGLAVTLFGHFRYRLWQRSALAQAEADLQAQRILQLEQEKRLLALSAMIEGQEQERRRIAKDLHDGMGGLLTSIKAHHSQPDAPSPDTVGQLIDLACTEVRRISHNMMPAALVFAGLQGALEDLAAQVRTQGLACHLDIIGPVATLSETQTTALYRIFQEAVNNTLKHAAATQLLLQIIVHDDLISVTIEDDGRGFAPSPTPPSTLGLRSIASRVDFLSGQWDIESAPGQGTTLHIQFPNPGVSMNS